MTFLLLSVKKFKSCLRSIFPIVIILSVSIGVNVSVLEKIFCKDYLSYSFPNKNDVIEVCTQMNGKTRRFVQRSSYCEFEKLSDVFKYITYFSSASKYYNCNGVTKKVKVTIVDDSFWNVCNFDFEVGRKNVGIKSVSSDYEEICVSYVFAKSNFSSVKNAIGKVVRLNDQYFIICGVVREGQRFYDTEVFFNNKLSFNKEYDKSGIRVYGRCFGILNENADANKVELYSSAVLDSLKVKYGGYSNFIEKTNLSFNFVKLNEYLGVNTWRAETFLYLTLLFSLFMLIVSLINVVTFDVLHINQLRNEVSVRLANGGLIKQVTAQILSYNLISLFSVFVLAMFLKKIFDILWDYLTNDHSIWISAFSLGCILIFLVIVVLFKWFYGYSTVRRISNRALAVNAGFRVTIINRMHRYVMFAQLLVSSFVVLLTVLMLVNTYESVSENVRGKNGDLQIITLELPAWKYNDDVSRKLFMSSFSDAIDENDSINNFSITSLLPANTKYDYLKAYSLDLTLMQYVDDVTVDPRKYTVCQVDIMPSYLNMLGCRLIDGRFLEESDWLTDIVEVLISKKMKSEIFKNFNPIGLKFKLGNRNDALIVGVVEDLSYHNDDLKGEGNYDNTIFVYSHINEKESKNRVLHYFIESSRKLKRSEVYGLINEIDRDVCLLQLVSYKEAVIDQYKYIVGGLVLSSAVMLVLVLVVFGGLSNYLRSVVLEKDSDIKVRIALGAKKKHLVKSVFSRLFYLLMLAVVFGAIVLGLVLNKLRRIEVGIIKNIEYYDIVIGCFAIGLLVLLLFVFNVRKLLSLYNKFSMSD